MLLPCLPGFSGGSLPVNFVSTFPLARLIPVTNGSLPICLTQSLCREVSKPFRRFCVSPSNTGCP